MIAAPRSQLAVVPAVVTVDGDDLRGGNEALGSEQNMARQRHSPQGTLQLRGAVTLCEPDQW
jgi:hypothetical protein